MEKVFLFAPGDSRKKIHKALSSKADAIIIDLEDAVVSQEKDNARNMVSSLLNDESINKIEPNIYVRVNAIQTKWFLDDIKMVNTLNNIKGIMIPKCEDKSAVLLAVEHLKEEVKIIPLIETVGGVMNVEKVLTSHPSVTRVAFGSVDFALDLGVEWSVVGNERIYAMSKIALISKAVKAEPPIDAVFPIINNKEAFIDDSKKGKQIGFYGKLIIHPKHIEWVKQVYAPNPEQIEWSHKVINVYENSNNIGVMDLDGKLVDLPMYLLAKRLITFQ